MLRAKSEEATMPQQVARNVIEHWRDGECLAKVEINDRLIERRPDGTARIILPPGGITLATGDELHFDLEGLADCLRGMAQ
jgi:hypothetical protein